MIVLMKTKLFGDFDFQAMIYNPDFKEDSVREVILLPILEALGYTGNNIVRSKTLKHPFLKIGSKKRPINLIPDYVLKVQNNFAWVLDAKAPNQNIKEGDNIEQVYSYATHPEIRSNYFALCNGLEFSVFKTMETNLPVLFFSIAEIDHHWESLVQYLSPNSFQSGKNFDYETMIATAKIAEIVIQTIERILAKNDSATLEKIYDELIIKGLELGFLDLLAKEYSDLTPILLGNFDYDENSELFTLKKDTKFKSHIDVKLRIDLLCKCGLIPLNPH